MPSAHVDDGQMANIMTWQSWCSKSVNVVVVVHETSGISGGGCIIDPIRGRPSVFQGRVVVVKALLSFVVRAAIDLPQLQGAPRSIPREAVRKRHISFGHRCDKLQFESEEAYIASE